MSANKQSKSYQQKKDLTCLKSNLGNCYENRSSRKHSVQSFILQIRTIFKIRLGTKMKYDISFHAKINVFHNLLTLHDTRNNQTQPKDWTLALRQKVWKFSTIRAKSQCNLHVINNVMFDYESQQLIFKPLQAASFVGKEKSSATSFDTSFFAPNEGDVLINYC